MVCCPRNNYRWGRTCERRDGLNLGRPDMGDSPTPYVLETAGARKESSEHRKTLPFTCVVDERHPRPWLFIPGRRETNWLLAQSENG